MSVHAFPRASWRPRVTAADLEAMTRPGVAAHRRRRHGEGLGDKPGANDDAPPAQAGRAQPFPVVDDFAQVPGSWSVASTSGASCHGSGPRSPSGYTAPSAPAGGIAEVSASARRPLSRLDVSLVVAMVTFLGIAAWAFHVAAGIDDPSRAPNALLLALGLLLAVNVAVLVVLVIRASVALGDEPQGAVLDRWGRRR